MSYWQPSPSPNAKGSGTSIPPNFKPELQDGKWQIKNLIQNRFNWFWIGLFKSTFCCTIMARKGSWEPLLSSGPQLEHLSLLHCEVLYVNIRTSKKMVSTLNHGFSYHSRQGPMVPGCTDGQIWQSYINLCYNLEDVWYMHTARLRQKLCGPSQMNLSSPCTCEEKLEKYLRCNQCNEVCLHLQTAWALSSFTGLMHLSDGPYCTTLDDPILAENLEKNAGNSATLLSRHSQLLGWVLAPWPLQKWGQK